MDNYRLLITHSFDHLPEPVSAMYSDRNTLLIICMARPYNRHRKSVLSVHLHQIFFTYNLVSGILPVRICQRRPFRDQAAFCRLMIRRRRTDKHILPCPVMKQPKIPLNIFYAKTDKFADHIKLHTTGLSCSILFIIDIRYDPFRPFWQTACPFSPV